MKVSKFEVRSLWKSYGEQRALGGVSFAVTAGENVAVLGPSGAGKSTVLRLLAGLDAPDSGEVFLDDRCVSERGRILLAPHRRGISMVFQDLALWPNLSARENVRLGLSALGLSRTEALERTGEALRLCGVEELAQRKPEAMSGGQQQRVALARAIAVRPAFLLLDEPYAGLDLVIKSRLLAEVRALAALQNMTVILVTHDPLEAMSLCRSAVVLDQGRLVEAGPLTELLKAPRSDLLRVFRDEFRRHEPKADPGEGLPRPAPEQIQRVSPWGEPAQQPPQGRRYARAMMAAGLIAAVLVIGVVIFAARTGSKATQSEAVADVIPEPVAEPPTGPAPAPARPTNRDQPAANHQTVELREKIRADMDECERTIRSGKSSKDYIELAATDRVHDWAQAAEQGMPEAQWLLGKCFTEGEEVAQSDTEAFKWYRKAAEQGYIAAEISVGWIYLSGRGVAKNDAEAFKWYRKAAEQGNADAQYNLGWMYANGRGMPPSPTEAVKWYRKAVEQGHERAKENLKGLEK